MVWFWWPATCACQRVKDGADWCPSALPLLLQHPYPQTYESKELQGRWIFPPCSKSNFSFKLVPYIFPHLPLVTLWLAGSVSFNAWKYTVKITLKFTNMPFYLKGLFPWKAFPVLYEAMLSNIKHFFKKWVHICLIFNSKQMVRVENMNKIMLEIAIKGHFCFKLQRMNRGIWHT